MQQQIRRGFLVDLDGEERHVSAIAERYGISRQIIYKRSEVRADGRRYLRPPRKGGVPKGVNPRKMRAA